MPIVVRPTETDREFARWALMTFLACQVHSAHKALLVVQSQKNEDTEPLEYALMVALALFRDVEGLTKTGRKIVDMAASGAANMMSKGGLTLNEIEALEKGQDPCAG